MKPQICYLPSHPNTTMIILGISAFYHDSAACITQDGEILAAAQEERFTRKKHDASFPKEAIRYCLDTANVRLEDLDAIAFYDKPLLKFERLLETYLSFAPRGLKSFITAMPVWLKEKMFMKRIMRDELNQIEEYDPEKVKFVFPEHHLSHAASAFYPSPFEEAAILTIDGVGEWATASICSGKGSEITNLRELTFPHSLGLLYSAFTYFLGFKVNSGEYKLMGLAPYGNPESELLQEYLTKIKTELVDIREDGSIYLNQDYFDYATGLKMIKEKKWEELFGFSKREEEAELQQHEADLALAIQKVTEEIVVLMAKEAKRLTKSNKLCMAGGVALNCVANGAVQNEEIFEDIFIQPAASDAGGAVGAALAAYHIYFDQERKPQEPDSMKGAYLGPEFHAFQIEEQVKSYNPAYQKLDEEALYPQVAQWLDEGKIVGWFQGRMEYGPRALGNRSILADPRTPEMQKKLNLKIKYRESFRPFAPSVMAEQAKYFFEMKSDSPYMLLVQPVKKVLRKMVPGDFDKKTLREKLAHRRSELPAITHIDFSARIQTVHQETNPRYWKLLNAFNEIAGLGMLVNTSFNVRGEPIVCTPEDAYRCFMNTEMDYLVMGDFVFKKEDQPEWEKKVTFDKD
ncbi:carbamoyltransferase [Gracilimonas mengyeensis]|uniref:Carbamoyltransferase n=2 Tax=Gracilimonas mengyeensis TaxID=1302730 RepID=A0A521BFW2_9BACT|nr:carbamoyltransferase [Gracilimonas mengyeensis]